MTNRAAFEAAISGPPYECDIARWPGDPKVYGWPGCYRDIKVALASQMWQEAARQEREACAKVCEEGAGFDGDHPHDVFAAAIRSRGEP